MKSKKEYNKKAKKHLMSSDLSLEDVNTLISSFDKLERQFRREEATSEDVSALIQNLLKSMPEEKKGKFNQGIRFLAKEYTSLLSFFTQSYKEIKQEQIQWIQNNRFKKHHQDSLAITKYLKHKLILPMLAEVFQTTEYSYSSQYFGPIPIIPINGRANRSTIDLLSRLDEILDDLIPTIENYSDGPAAIRVYALSLFYLNKKRSEKAPVFADYLEKKEDNPVKAVKKIAPAIMAVDSNVMYLFNAGFTNQIPTQINQNILLSTDKKSSEILESLLQQMQHFYNKYYVKKEDRTVLLKIPQPLLNGFVNFTSKMHLFESILPVKSIIKDIQTVLKKFSLCPQSKQTMDTLSSELTLLLTYYSPNDVRAVINTTLENLEILIYDQGNANEIEKVFKGIDKAFSIIEQTLEHLSWALVNFKLDRTAIKLERSTRNMNEPELVAPMKEKLSEMKTSHSQINGRSWHARIRVIESLEKSANIFNQITYHQDPAFTLFQQAELGNNEAIQELLLVNTDAINQLDKKGFSPLTYAVSKNHRSTVELLLKYGADFNWLGTVNEVKNNNLLMAAAYYGSYDVIPLLLNKGVSALEHNAEKQTALMILVKKIAHQQISEESYKKSLIALIYLLAYGPWGDEKTSSHKNKEDKEFIYSLKMFQKNLALFHILFETGSLRGSNLNIALEVLLTITAQLKGYVINEQYKNCYSDILRELSEETKLYSRFISQGTRAAYSELSEVRKIKPKIYKAPFHFFGKKQTSSEVDLSLEEQTNSLIAYYTPRSLLMGIESLTGLTLAKKQLASVSEGPKSKKLICNQRRAAITIGKEKIAEKQDNKLFKTLYQACKEMNISEIDSVIYRKLATVLFNLVVKQGKSPLMDSQNTFLDELKADYQDCSPRLG